jgi:hypothetical protein
MPLSLAIAALEDNTPSFSKNFLSVKEPVLPPWELNFD